MMPASGRYSWEAKPEQGYGARVNIFKYLDHEPWGLNLDGRDALPLGTLHAGMNRLIAKCKSAEGEQVAHLAFFVNGKEVVTATDKKGPFMHGTVGCYVPVGENSEAEAEFDNLVVMQR